MLHSGIEEATKAKETELAKFNEQLAVCKKEYEKTQATIREDVAKKVDETAHTLEEVDKKLSAQLEKLTSLQNDVSKMKNAHNHAVEDDRRAVSKARLGLDSAQRQKEKADEMANKARLVCSCSLVFGMCCVVLSTAYICHKLLPSLTGAKQSRALSTDAAIR